MRYVDDAEYERQLQLAITDVRYLASLRLIEMKYDDGYLFHVRVFPPSPVRAKHLMEMGLITEEQFDLLLFLALKQIAHGEQEKLDALN